MHHYYRLIQRLTLKRLKNEVLKIQFCVATNWDFNLIDELAKYPVKDIYGVAKFSMVGHGRPSFLLNEVTEEKIAEYIKKVHEKKMRFSYLLNAPCMNNMEYDAEYHKNAASLVPRQNRHDSPTMLFCHRL